jgi:hypothetical protein
MTDDEHDSLLPRLASLEQRVADLRAACSRSAVTQRRIFLALRMRPNNVSVPENFSNDVPQVDYGSPGSSPPDNDPLPEAPYLWREHERLVFSTSGTATKDFSTAAASNDGRNCRVVDEDTPDGINFGKLFQPAGGQFLVLEMTDVNPDGSLASRFIEVPRGLFPVKVAQTGGTQGTQTTPATFTYEVRELAGGGAFYPQSTSEAGGAVAGDDVPVVVQRPNGQFHAGEDYGIAFWHGPALKLFDAGETPIRTEEECP